MNSFYQVIIAGGSGSRFWPQSRKNKPKQLLKIINDETMIGLTYKRLKTISNADHILIVASKGLCLKIQKEIPEIPKENFIIEPSGKNTAPAIGLAALHVLQRDSNAIMGVYPADHLIQEENKFQDVIRKAQEMVKKKTSLITIGVKPTYAATGYGYIHYDPLEKNEISSIYKVKKFVEKPSKENAEILLNTGEYLWNGGMFIWKAKTILSEIKTLMPNLFKSLDLINKVIFTPKNVNELEEEWNTIIPESIDYGILEKSKNVYTIEADFKWKDMGSWKSLFSIHAKNKDQNYHEGDVISLKSSNNLIISPNRLTAVIGIDNLSIINLEDATLIVPHDDAESVKDIVEMLKSLNKNKYL